MLARALLSLAVALLLAAPATAATDPLRAHQWNLDMIEADAAHQTSVGAGALVAVVDSGVALGHPDLAGRLATGVDLIDGDTTPADGNGHGTHVSGIIAADAGNGVGVDSVAPAATILPIRVLDDSGSGSSDAVAHGIDIARERGADVINLSLGSEVPLVGAMGGDPTDAAIRRALVRVPRGQRHGKVRRRGLVVRLRAVRSGVAHLRLRVHGRTVGRATRRLTAGHTRTIHLRAGRKRLARARHGRLLVRLPGEARVRARRVTLR
jgi:Subtilase family